MRIWSTLALAVIGTTACSGRDKDPVPEVQRDPQRTRRVIEPPPGTVRPLPPHAIRADGVGPYRLGERLDQLLEQLPSGPRIALFDIPQLVHRSLIRAEDDTVLIGGEPTTTASFVAVVGAEVARTESGAHVGSSKDELVRALGPLVDDVETARDPHLVVPSSFRNLHAILDGTRIVALVVTAEPARAPEDVTNPCVRPPPPDKGFSACLTASGELVAVEGDEISILAPDTDHPIATLRLPNLVFAATLRNTAEARDELVAITRVDEPSVRGWSLSAYRLEGNRLVRVLDPSAIYQLSSASSRWIGAEIRDVDLYLELTSRAESFEIGGFLTTRTADKIRDVVVISPVLVPRKRGKATPADIPAATSDASVVEPPDAGNRPRP